MNWLAVPPVVWMALPYAGGVMLFSAGLLAAWALRGASVGWHPICRRCSHDLRALDPSDAACPECGANLARPGAVRTGERARRRGAVIAAWVATAVAVAAFVWLTPARTEQLRARLIASMRLERLVDVVVAGSDESPHVRLAERALEAQLGSVGGHRVPGGKRSVPSGELLDAFLKAFARCDEPGRAPRAAVPLGPARKVLGNLDGGERERLIALAADELIASAGARGDLARCVAAIDWNRGDAESRSLARLEERLRSTAEGRAVLAPHLMGSSSAPSGGLISLDLRSPFDDLLRNGASAPDAPLADALFIERAEAVPADAAAGERAILLNPHPTVRGHSRREGMPPPSLLADLPPGSYAIRVRGVIAPQALVPMRNTVRDVPFTDMTAAEAAALEGAHPIDQTLSVEILPMPDPAAPFLRVRDDEVVRAFAEWLGAARISASQSGNLLRFEHGGARGRGAAPPHGGHFRVVAKQDGASHHLGQVSIGGGQFGYLNWSTVSWPSEIVMNRPMEVVLEPSPLRNQGMWVFEGVQRSGVWARFTLAFSNSTASPSVLSETLPETPVVATALKGEEARAMLHESVLRANSTEWLRERSLDSSPDGLIFRFAALTDPVVDREQAAALGPILLSGIFELRSEGSLLAPTRASVTVGTHGWIIKFDLTPSVAKVFPHTLRFTPNPGMARAEIPISFRYMAAPFELRFTDPLQPPELVWVEQLP